MSKLATLGRMLLDAIIHFLILCYQAFTALLSIMSSFTGQYRTVVKKFTEKPEDPTSVKFWRRSAWIRFPIRVFLMMLVPLVFVLVPVGLVGVVGFVMITIDQALWPSHKINPKFADQTTLDMIEEGGWEMYLEKLEQDKKTMAEDPAEKPAEVEVVEKPIRKMTTDEKGVLLMEAVTWRLDQELHSPLGWAPNDLLGGQLLDNRLNCQLGTLNITRSLLEKLSSEISRFSDADETNPQLVKAGKEMAYTPDHWIMPESETSFINSISYVREYNRGVLAGDRNFRVNITTQDITTILDAIIDAISEPRGRVSGSGHIIPWSELDDRVYYAGCSAAVAQDVFSALWVSFHSEMEKGAEENVMKAIYALNSAAALNPPWVARGDGKGIVSSMTADHRSKMSRYITEAIELMKVVRNSIKN